MDERPENGIAFLVGNGSHGSRKAAKATQWQTAFNEWDFYGLHGYGFPKKMVSVPAPQFDFNTTGGKPIGDKLCGTKRTMARDALMSDKFVSLSQWSKRTETV